MQTAALGCFKVKTTVNTCQKKLLKYTCCVATFQVPTWEWLSGCVMVSDNISLTRSIMSLPAPAGIQGTDQPPPHQILPMVMVMAVAMVVQVQVLLHYSRYDGILPKTPIFVHVLLAFSPGIIHTWMLAWNYFQIPAKMQLMKVEVVNKWVHIRSTTSSKPQAQSSKQTMTQRFDSCLIRTHPSSSIWSRATFNCKLTRNTSCTTTTI